MPRICKYAVDIEGEKERICRHKKTKEIPFNMPCNQQNCPWPARQDNKKWWENHPGEYMPEIKKKNRREITIVKEAMDILGKEIYYFEIVKKETLPDGTKIIGLRPIKER